jgi:hypothetical protein
VHYLESHEVSFLGDDPSKADGRRTGLKGFYYTMNNHQGECKAFF